MANKLQGKVAIITGASAGIGAALADEVARVIADAIATPQDEVDTRPDQAAAVARYDAVPT